MGQTHNCSGEATTSRGKSEQETEVYWIGGGKASSLAVYREGVEFVN